LEAEFAALGEEWGWGADKNPEFAPRVSELRVQYAEIGLRKWDGICDDFDLTATLVCTGKASTPWRTTWRTKIKFREIRDNRSLGDEHFYFVYRDVNWINVGSVYKVPTHIVKPTTLYLNDAKLVGSWLLPVEVRDSS
jgi:hypothetical protein